MNATRPVFILITEDDRVTDNENNRPESESIKTDKQFIIFVGLSYNLNTLEVRRKKTY